MVENGKAAVGCLCPAVGAQCDCGDNLRGPSHIYVIVHHATSYLYVPVRQLERRAQLQSLVPFLLEVGGHDELLPFRFDPCGMGGKGKDIQMIRVREKRSINVVSDRNAPIVMLPARLLAMASVLCILSKSVNDGQAA